MSKKQFPHNNKPPVKTATNVQKKPSRLAYIITAVLIFFWFVGSCLGTFAFIENRVKDKSFAPITAGAVSQPTNQNNFDSKTYNFTANALTGMSFIYPTDPVSESSVLTSFDFSFSMLTDVVRVSFKDYNNNTMGFDVPIGYNMTVYTLRSYPSINVLFFREDSALPDNGIPYWIRYAFHGYAADTSKSVLDIQVLFVDENGAMISGSSCVMHVVFNNVAFSALDSVISPYMNASFPASLSTSFQEDITNVRLYDYYKRYADGYSAGYNEGYNEGYATAILENEDVNRETFFDGSSTVSTVVWTDGTSSTFNTNYSSGQVYYDPEILYQINPIFKEKTISQAFIQVNMPSTFSLYRYRFYAFAPFAGTIEFFEDGTDISYSATVSTVANSAGLYPLVFTETLPNYARCDYFEITTDSSISFSSISFTLDGSLTNDYDEGYSDGYAIGRLEGYGSGFASGKEVGDREGFRRGYSEGVSVGSAQGYNNGYNTGYNAGVDAGTNPDYTFVGLISAVVDVPIRSLTSLLDFNILGVNMSQFFFSLFSVCVVLFVVKLLI